MFCLPACQIKQEITPSKTTPAHIRGEQVNFSGIHETRAKTFAHHYILEADTKRKQLALTFDDGPSKYTLEILEILQSYNIPATFFMLGAAMKKHPNIVKHVHQQGHQIANHSWDHTNAQDYQSLEQFWQAQVQPQMVISQQLIGESSNYFRPPYGSISDQQVRFLAKHQITTVIWSIDTQDWDESNNTPELLATRANKYQHPGAIILMHDGGGQRENTVASLRAIIEHYLHQGYQFTRLDDLLTQS